MGTHEHVGGMKAAVEELFLRLVKVDSSQRRLNQQRTDMQLVSEPGEKACGCAVLTPLASAAGVYWVRSPLTGKQVGTLVLWQFSPTLTFRLVSCHFAKIDVRV